MSARRAILNVSVGSWYPKGQSRLARSLYDVGETAEPMFWRGRYPHLSPTHQQVSYGFKPYAFVSALMAGYDQALWLDSSCVVTRPLTEVWETIDAKGYCFGLEGWKVGEWINDSCLKLTKLTREKAMKIPLMEGKIVGLDLRNFRSKRFLSEWLRLCDSGGFNGSWEDHRHDITCGAIVAHRLDMELTPGLISLDKSPALIHASGM